MGNELEEKTGRLVAVLERENLGGVLLNAQHNFAWLTGGSSNGIDLSRENGAAYLFVGADGKRFVLANNIEMPRLLAEEISADHFEPVEFTWQDEKAAGNFVIEKAKALATNGDIVTDITIDAGTKAVEGKIAQCRYSLTADETERFRLHGRDAGVAVRNVIDKLTSGETEIEIAEKLRHEFALAGMASVVTLVAADERIARYRHPVRTAKRWEKMVMLVTCAKRRGLITSLSRIVCIGDVPAELKQKTEAAAYVNACLMDASRPGATGAELYKVAADAYAARDFANEINRHHQGGAAGYKTREWVAHPNNTEVVQPNQAFAWNPSITGTKVEETCIASENGVEILTASPDFPQITTIVNGREYSSPGILSL